MTSGLSGLSSLKEDDSPLYVQPHYKETYRLAIYALLCGGRDAYEEFLSAEQISHFLSEEEIFFILQNAESTSAEDDDGGGGGGDDDAEVREVTVEALSPSTYFPMESDEEVPDLDLGWPEVTLDGTDTSISLLFQPPRESTPSIKEVVRKQIQEARKVIAIAMDIFTDVDIFKEVVSATLRGVVVYILLDDAQFSSFLTMSHRVGVNIQELKNIRVRTVQGQQYQCQSGVKFYGEMEQKFILIDCQTVLYGTYSYTWSYEKIHLSMVLVVTGQLVSSYDEEFRRLYARSTVPEVLSREKLSTLYLRDTVTLQSPNSSQLSLHQLHTTPRGLHGIRSAQDDRLNNAANVLTRGVSVQDRLHQSHCPEMGTLVRGHSYGGELQKLNSMTRLRMGTKDVGSHDRTKSHLRGGGRLSQQHLRHRSRYGPDQNLIPFNSETSLNRWKMDTYFNENEAPLDASTDALSPLVSPYSSHTGLNDHQSQLIHNRSREIKTRLEEMRQKRLSLQDYTNLRQSQESLRSTYPTLERPKYMSSLRNLDVKQSGAELDPQAQNGRVVDSPIHKIRERERGSEPLSRTVSAADLDMKMSEQSLKLSHLQTSTLSIQHLRTMESLMEIPEEKDSSNTRINVSDVTHNGCEESSKEETADPKGKISSPAESQRTGEVRGSRGSLGKLANSSGSATPKEKKKSVSKDVDQSQKVSNPEHQHSSETKGSHSEKRREDASLQRKNSMRMKVQSMLSSDEKKEKASKKEDKSVHRKSSFRSHNTSGSNQPVRGDHSQTPAAAQTSRKGQSPTTSRVHNSSSPAEGERHKAAFPRLSPHRSSKRKTNLTSEQDRGSKNDLDDDGATVYQTRREKAYSRYEYLLSTERIPMDKSMRMTSMYSSERDVDYQTQSGTDNKLGRFMQRVGNLISKNK